MVLPDVEKTPMAVEKYEVIDHDLDKAQEPGAMGTVTLSDSTDVIMVPAPSVDPRGIICVGS